MEIMQLNGLKFQQIIVKAQIKVSILMIALKHNQ